MIDVTLCTMTMDAGNGIPGSTLRWALKNNYFNFSRVIVVDGNLTEEAKLFYKQFKNVEVIDSPWTDNYVKQYRAAIDLVEDGAFALWLDDDEVISAELESFLSDSNLKEEDNLSFWKSRASMIKLPCVLHLTENGKDYIPCEDAPSEKYYGQWTKNILFRKTPNLTFKYFGSHVIPHHQGKERETYVRFPYYHMKSFESFVYNDVWQAYLHPQGQGYSDAESSQFKMFTMCFRNTKEFKESTKKGTWPPPLKKFAWDRRMAYDRPISRLSWVYWILEGHLMPEYDSAMVWENVIKHVVSKTTQDLYSKNKKEGRILKCH